MTAPGPHSAQVINSLQDVFRGSDVSSHGDKWDSLWKASDTPWDRGGPSLALADAIRESPELSSVATQHDSTTHSRKTALVPGCGRGWDAVLLAALGYDVVGLDYSAAAIREAAANEESVRQGKDKEVYDSVAVADRGKVTWVQDDFWDDAWLEKVGGESSGFDLIFDYTFFCALPPEARPKWAKRTAELLAPGAASRLICLEWPLAKPASSGGPPWGLVGDMYVAHLSRPGEEVRYCDEDGKPLAEDVQRPKTDAGLKRLIRFHPNRTHKAGCDAEGKVVDCISIWSH